MISKASGGYIQTRCTGASPLGIPAEPIKLDSIGDGKLFEYHASPSCTSCQTYFPLGFTGNLSRSATFSELQQVVATALEVRVDDVELVYEGKALKPSSSLDSSGIPSPGPAAKKAGAKINIEFILNQGVELPISQRAYEEAQKAKQEREAVEADKREEQLRQIEMQEEEHAKKTKEMQLEDEMVDDPKFLLASTVTDISCTAYQGVKLQTSLHGLSGDVQMVRYFNVDEGQICDLERVVAELKPSWEIITFKDEIGNTIPKSSLLKAYQQLVVTGKVDLEKEAQNQAVAAKMSAAIAADRCMLRCTALGAADEECREVHTFQSQRVSGLAFQIGHLFGEKGTLQLMYGMKQLQGEAFLREYSITSGDRIEYIVLS